MPGSSVYVKPILHDSTQHGFTLTILHLKVDHAGTYKCVVDNRFGQIEGTVNVKVLDAHGGGSGAGKFEFILYLVTS